jgi:hypothetical protein
METTQFILENMETISSIVIGLITNLAFGFIKYGKKGGLKTALGIFSGVLKDVQPLYERYQEQVKVKRVVQPAIVEPIAEPKDTIPDKRFSVNQPGNHILRVDYNSQRDNLKSPKYS